MDKEKLKNLDKLPPDIKRQFALYMNKWKEKKKETDIKIDASDIYTAASLQKVFDKLGEKYEYTEKNNLDLFDKKYPQFIKQNRKLFKW